jgi:hypothetical protein
MGVRVEQPRSPVKKRPHITIVPVTVLGRWAIGLAVSFFALVFAAAVMPMAAALGFVCSVSRGVLHDTRRPVLVVRGVRTHAMAEKPVPVVRGRS